MTGYLSTAELAGVDHVSDRSVTDPGMPNGTGAGAPIPFTRTAGQAMRSSTTGDAVNSVSPAAMP